LICDLYLVFQALFTVITKYVNTDSKWV